MKWKREVAIALILMFLLFLAETMLTELQKVGLT